MKAIMIMFDSLNRRMLPPYGCNWVHSPNQEHPIKDNDIENIMLKNMIRLMKENDAPIEQFQRLGLTKPQIK